MAVEHVAFLSSEYPPRTYGGLGTTVEALSRFLADSGMQVTVLVPGGTTYAQPPRGVDLLPVPVEDATSDEDYWLTYGESAADEARSVGLRADLVHAHDWMTALGGFVVGRDLDVPVLLSVHLPQTGGPNRALEDVGLCGSDAVLVNSTAVSTEIILRNLPTGELFVVPNGVDLARFVPPDHGTVRHQVLYVGRLVPQKGVDVLLRAFGAVLHRQPDTALVIVGDGEQRLYLERLARFLGLRQHVEFLGWRSTDEVANLYQSSAVTCVPSIYEPFGLVALEAMASGCPVVVTRVGGLAEIVADDTAGLMVEPGDHLDLASAIAALVSDSARARAMGLAARRRATQFNWTVIAEQTRHLYDELASRPRRNPLTSTAAAALMGSADRDLRQRALTLLEPDTIPRWPTTAPEPLP
jgi:glycosyltransferase involved in cell wall biosynthesis